MAKSAKQKLKLLYLLDKLKTDTDENHGITIDEMAEYLDKQGIGSERKSLYNDIEMLRTYGYEIEMQKMNRKAYYKLLSRDFELAELKLLVDSVQAAKFLSEKQTNTLIKKLESFVSKYEAGDLQRQVFVVNRVKNDNKRVILSVDELHRAIHENKQVTFIYNEWNMKKELVPRHNGQVYEVSPWALSWEDENYYLIGYDERERKIKHFRVDKITSLAVVEKARNGEELFEKFDLANYSKSVFGMYGGAEKNVKLRLPSYLVGVIVDRFGKEVMIIPELDGQNFTVRVDVQTSPQFFGWLVGLGDGVSIVEPEDVKLQFQNHLKKILKGY